MESSTTAGLLGMFPHFLHVVERIATPSWRINNEICKKHNLILIYGGEALFGCNGREYRGSEGDLVYFKPVDFRWAYTFTEQPLRCFAVDFLYTCPVWGEHGWQLTEAGLPFQTLEKINDAYLLARLTDLFKDFTRLWLSGQQRQIIRRRAVFMEIISLLLAWKNGGGIHFDKIRKVEKVINYLTENYPRRITLEELGVVIQVSPSYLGAIFKEVTGTSPIDYLIGIRINKAKQLIRDGHSVSEVAQATGFNDIFYFSKCFKKWEGMAPSEYRGVEV